jgi:outer membrane protein insertion porin family
MMQSKKLMLCIVLYTFTGILFLTTILQAQEEVFKINHIRIEGNERADSALVILNSGLIRGASVSADEIQRAIRNLWALGLFSDIQIYSERQSPAGLDLLIRLEEYSRLEGWDVSGNEKLKKKEIAQETGFYSGMVYTPFKAYKAQKALIDKYKEKGYLLAKVAIDTLKTETNSVLVNMKIEEGEKVQVEKIRVMGNGGIPGNELRKAFKEIKEDRWWRGADFDRRKYEKDLENVLALCRKKGFRDAEVVKDSIYYSDDQRDLFIDVYVNEGRQYYFGNITFEGNTVFEEQLLRAQLLFQKGGVYNQEYLDKSIRENIQNLYYNQGYLFANIHPLEIPVSEDTVDVAIRINEGHVVRIKEIIITGNPKTNEKVIRREFKLYPGDVFNRAKLERSVRDVWITNYFSNIVPDVKLLPNDDKHVNIEVAVEEKSTDTANLSAGYSGSEGFIGSIGFSLNNFSLKHPLSGGDGQRLSFQWDFGQSYRNLSLSFIEPWAFGTPTLVGFSLFDSYSGVSYQPWESKTRGGSLQLGRRFRWPDNFFRGDWTFRVANNKIFNISDEYYTAIYGDGYTSLQVSLSQVIRRDSRDRPEFPTRGTVFSLSSKLAGGPLQGNEDFIKNVFNMEWYVPMRFGTVLFVNSKFAAIGGLRDDFYINPNELFYMGGSGLGFAESLRGYDDGTIGPVNESGNAIGGRSMTRFTAELRIPIAPNPTIFGLLFMEAGNVWDTFNATNLSDLKRSVGIGARLFMPLLGIIGVDFGYGFDYYDRFGNRKGQWKIHFKFGQF